MSCSVVMKRNILAKGGDGGKRTTTSHNSRVSHEMLRIDSVVKAVWLTSAKQGLVRCPTHLTLTLLLPFLYWIPMPSNLLADISLQQLKQAIAIREKIDDLEKELSRIIGGQPSTAKAGAPAPERKRRKMSAAARAKISAAAKARWAKFRAKKAKK